MHITLAKSAGFCFGVKRAVSIALETATDCAQVEMLGDIVHNEDVVRQIEAAGIKKVSALSACAGTFLLVRAHGASRQTFEKARKLGYTVVDATCPMVKEIHRIAVDMEGRGYRIIIIGDRRHDEVQGIVGQLSSEALVIDSPEHIPTADIDGIERAAAVVQSTQTQQNVEAVMRSLRQHIPELKFFDTICKPTREKQAEIMTMPLGYDVMIILGSKTSANTKRLYELSRSINNRSHWIQKAGDMQAEWFHAARSVGVTAGASTPEHAIKNVIEALEKM